MTLTLRDNEEEEKIEESRRICFYHSKDFDGICSAAIIKNKFPDCELYGIDYGEEFPWEKVGGKTIYMVDYSLQPFSEMIRLVKSNNLIWLDHHATAIKNYEKYLRKGNESWGGKRSEEFASCELTWDYLFDTESPRVVKLLGRYDVWDHSDPDVVPFQYGMRAVEGIYDPTHWFWEMSFQKDLKPDKIIKNGKIILRYKDIYNQEYMKKYAFEASWKVGGKRYKVIAVNMGFISSKHFKSVWEPEKHDLMIAFNENPSGYLNVSLRTKKEGINCGEIAEKFGGGGHLKAAGFEIEREDLELIRE